EIMRLYREKNINPAGMLGCAPMFLQMPIWIALYAMLYLAIELRQQWAFYGVFQHLGTMIRGRPFEFLADLSQPDRFIVLSSHPPHTPFGSIGQLDSSPINLPPLVWAAVFFWNQKLTMPPPADEQQAQQQKMMKIVSLITPLLLYSAPSGLTLYTLVSTAAGI